MMMVYDRAWLSKDVSMSLLTLYIFYFNLSLLPYVTQKILRQPKTEVTADSEQQH